MKQIHKMTQEETKELVSFQITSSGPTLYYDKIEAIGPAYMIYNGATVESVTEPQLKAILTGKENYEIYKVLSASANAAEFIKSKSEEVIRDSYESTLHLHLETMTERTDQLVERTTKTLRQLSNAAGKTDDMCIEMELTTSHIKESLTKIDVDGLRDKVNTLSSSFLPLKDSLNSIITELRTLFK